MTKILGLFTLTYARPLLDWELQKMIIKYLRSSQLEYIITKYPIDWDWNLLAAHISLEYIDKNERNWNWSAVSRNCNISINYLLKNLHKNWNWSNLSINPQIKPKDVFDNYQLNWDYFALSGNINFTLNDIKGYEHNPWNYDRLGGNNMKISDLNNWSGYLINWDYLSESSAITIEDVLSYEGDWNYFIISEKPGITAKIISDNIHQNWNWFYLSKHPNITMEDIINYPGIPWRYCSVSKNINITFQFVMNNFKKDWDYTSLMINPSLSTKEKELICKEIQLHANHHFRIK